MWHLRNTLGLHWILCTTKRKLFEKINRTAYNGEWKIRKNWGQMMTTVLIIVLIALIAFLVFRYFKQRAFLKTLTEDQFRAGYRKAQLIDVREPQEFKKGHIL